MQKLLLFVLLAFPLSVISSEFNKNLQSECSKGPKTKESRYSFAKSGSINASNLTIMGINVPNNSMKDLATILPKPLISDDQPGCASCSDYACYLTKDESTALIFYRYAAWDLNGFEILKASKDSLPIQCISTRLEGESILTESGIGLGLTKAEVSKRLDLKDVEGKVVFSQQKLMEPEIMEQHIQMMGSNSVECDYFYVDATTTVIAEYDETGLSKYSVRYTESM